MPQMRNHFEMVNSSCSLNERARQRCQSLIDDSEALRVAVSVETGATVIDCGVKAAGGLEAGRVLAEVCLGGRAQVQLVPSDWAGHRGPAVTVATDAPLEACLGAQYAGWPISVGKYFAMGSGPMRCLRGREAVLEEYKLIQSGSRAVGVLETGKLPSADVCRQIADECKVPVDALTLLVAPTASLAGTLQIVARSVETALHKLHTLHFDLTKVVSGFGVAPLPPVAANDLQGIGFTNDAVLYGSEVTLWIRGSNDELKAIGPQIPSSSSRDFGRPFAEIFESYERDFYRIDPLLFSPAVVNLASLETGRIWRFGERHPEILQRSFGCESGS